MGPEALEAGNRLIQMDQRLIGVEGLVVKGDSGARHVIGGFGTKLRETWQRTVRRLGGLGFPFCRHVVPLPLDARPVQSPKPLILRALRLRLR